jgi:6-phosphogluconate dehydrogenase
MSDRKDERIIASKVLEGSRKDTMLKVDKVELVKNLEADIYCAKVASYAQGLGIIKAASDDKGWGVNLSVCARIYVVWWMHHSCSFSLQDLGCA